MPLRAAASVQPSAMRAQHSCISRSTPIAAISLCQMVSQSRMAASVWASIGDIGGSGGGFRLVMQCNSLRAFWYQSHLVII